MFSVRRIRAAPLSCFPQQLGRELRKKTDVDGIYVQENKNHGPLRCDTAQSGTGIPIFQYPGMYYQIHTFTAMTASVSSAQGCF